MDSDDEVTNEIAAAVAQAIRDRRIELGYSQAKVAESIGISHQQMQKLEVGDNRVSAGRIGLLCRVLNVDPNYFFEPVLGRLKLLSPTNGDLLSLKRSIIDQVVSINDVSALRAVEAALSIIAESGSDQGS